MPSNQTKPNQIKLRFVKKKTTSIDSTLIALVGLEEGKILNSKYEECFSKNHSHAGALFFCYQII